MMSRRMRTRNALFVGLAGLVMSSTATYAIAQSHAPSPKPVIAGANLTYYVSPATLNVRTGPGEAHKIASTFRRGDVVHIYEQKGDWARVSRQGEAARWVYLPLLTRDKPAPDMQRTAARPPEAPKPADHGRP